MSSKASRPYTLLAVVCVAAVVGVLTGATSPLSATRFADTGHWVYNSVLGAVFHVDGATTNIDAQMALEAEVGSQVLQSDVSGFVVGPSRITEFDKASLTPQKSSQPPAKETPLGIEVVGGPYAVYRKAGKIVRLGDPFATIPADGPIGVPVVTEDGTMWLHQTKDGRICRLDRAAVTLSGCPLSAPRDHAGALTIVDGRPAFLDLFTSQLHDLGGSGFGRGVPLGVSLSPTARPAAQDTHGRVAILDPSRSSLIMVDTTSQPAKPVTVALPAGDYDGPVSTGEVVALVDRQKGTVLTFGADGKPKDTQPVKPNGQPKLSQGEDDRIYVEDADGTQVLVVDQDGSVKGVDVAEKPTTPTEAPAPPTTENPAGPSGPPAGPPVRPQPPVQPPPVPPGRPGAPPSVAAQAGNGSATVTWDTAPDNRAPITSYVVTWQGGSTPVGPGARQAVIGNLANGVTYVFTVAATNQVGSGPGTSSNPVTPVSPVSPAGPPANLQANYDVDDRPTRDVTLTWGQPALNGGTLVRYDVTATGRGTQPVPGNQVTYPQVESTEAITFTVVAITRSPDGQELVGQPASTTHQADPPPRMNLSKGRLTEDSCGQDDDCAWMYVELIGFAPNTFYDVEVYSSDPGYENTGHGTTTDANGYADFNQFAYSGQGDTVWVDVTLPNGTVVRSANLEW
ncbi:fibronectin type III domain-containing protein [Actinophytocola sp.]|uniref:fibronectin type III domain-containing protein n=1 Tax=Actinophytocola sp. TaxID=1872138 RepID=UPI002ED547E8